MMNLLLLLAVAGVAAADESTTYVAELSKNDLTWANGEAPPSMPSAKEARAAVSTILLQTLSYQYAGDGAGSAVEPADMTRCGPAEAGPG